MSLLKLILHLISCLGLTLLTAVAGEPRGQFLILRAGNETADPLVVAVKGKKFTSDELTSRITALIDEKKIEQLASFDQAFDEGKFEAKHFECIQLSGEILDLSTDERIKMGVTFQAEVTVAEDFRKAYLSFVLDIREKKSREDYSQQRMGAAINIYGDHWALIGSWKNSRSSTLALFRVINHPATVVAQLESPAAELQMELLEVKTDDLAQFRKSTPATHQKALLWLRERAELLACTTLKSNPGDRIPYDDEVRSSKGEIGGLSLKSEQITSGDGKKVDVTISAQWQDPERLSAVKDYSFKVGETLNPGQTEIYESSAARHLKGTQPVLVITPQITLPQNFPQKIRASPDPKSIRDRISSEYHPVAAKFMRTLREMHSPQEPGRSPGLKEMLVKLGLEFGPETSVNFSREGCEVFLTQTREGHLKFMAMVKALNLQP